MKFLIEMYHMTFGFFTTLPVKFIEWDTKKMKYVPLFMPMVGLVLGGLSYILFWLCQYLEVSSFFTSVVLVVYFIVITGGLHLDAVMDTCDAHFSRRPKERKLEIMKDSRVGAFAVVGFFVLMVLKLCALNEVLLNHRLGLNLIFIPLISRTVQPLYLFNVPFATNEGLALMYGNQLKKKEQFPLWIVLIVTVLIGYYVIGVQIVLLVGVALGYFLFYRRFALEQFGGITGDIIGAFLEVVEVLMIMSLLIRW